MPSTETRPVTSDTDTGEGDGYAHYAGKTEITRAAVLGGTVTALCGYRFPPVGTPSGSRCARGARSWPPCSGLRLGTRDGPGSGDDAPP